jgi:RNA polymerase sigma factor (sigma-70 family)
MSEDSSLLQVWIDRLRAGDLAARDELIRHAGERLRRLTRRMFSDFARVRQWEETDDVVQNASLRLWNALQTVTPDSVSGFLSLAARQIRRELLDLARHYFGPQGQGTNQVHHSFQEPSDSTAQVPQHHFSTWDDPGRLEGWCEFHQQVEALPTRECAVFDLLWYHGLTQVEAAKILNVSEQTVKRAWLSARMALQAALKGHEVDLD